MIYCLFRKDMIVGSILLLVIGFTTIVNADVMQSIPKTCIEEKYTVIFYGNDEADVPTWNLGDTWLYDFDLIARADESDFQATLRLDLFDLLVTITSEIDELYKIGFDGSVFGDLSIKIEDLPEFSSTLKNTLIEGYATIEKNSLGIKEFYIQLDGKLSVGVIPIPVEIKLNITYDPPFNVLDFPLSVGKNWSIISSNVSVDGMCSLYGIANLLPGFPEEFPIQQKSVTGGEDAECIRKMNLKVMGGAYKAYEIIIEYSEEVVKHYYAPTFGNIIKISTSEFPVDIFYVEFSYKLKSSTYTIPGAPEKPDRPTGPTEGSPDTEYTYSSSTNDPEDDQIYYWFDWGDETNSSWLGPYTSGALCEASHRWIQQGSYNIMVKAKDTEDHETLWSDSLTVSMPKIKIINSLTILKNRLPTLT